MFRSLGPKPFFFPMPVLLVATYDKDKKVDVMNMAWDGSFGLNTASFNINPIRKTFRNLQTSRAFTLTLADVPHLEVVDYFGMVSGNTVEDKFERTGLKAEQSQLVNAPILVDFPLTAECEVIELDQEGSHVHVVGRILNTIADERLFDESGNVAPERLQGFSYDVFHSDYYSSGKRIGRAWSYGTELAKRKPKEEGQEDAEK